MGLGWIRGGFVVYVFADTKGWAELWSSPSIISSNLWPPVHGAGAGDGRAGGVHGPRPGLCQPKRPVCLPSHRRKPEMWIGGLCIFSGFCSCCSLCRGKKYHSILRDRKTCFSLYCTIFCSSDLGTFSTHFLLIFIFARSNSIFYNYKIKMQRELYFCEALLGYGINIIILLWFIFSKFLISDHIFFVSSRIVCSIGCSRVHHEKHRPKMRNMFQFPAAMLSEKVYKIYQRRHWAHIKYCFPHEYFDQPETTYMCAWMS